MVFFKKIKEQGAGRSLKAKYTELKDLLRHAQKVYAYRWDILSPQDKNSLEIAIQELEDLLKQKKQSPRKLSEQNRPNTTSRTTENSEGEELKKVEPFIQNIQKLLSHCGGTLYPVKFIPDNVEMFLVAAILAIGIRFFFLQPFEIPTNSMYPTYFGMTPHVYALKESPPDKLHQLWRKITLGAKHYEIKASQKGEVAFRLFQPINPLSTLGRVEFKQVIGRKWFGFLPEMLREYTLFVGQEAITIRVPWDFNLDSVIKDTFFGSEISFDAVLKKLNRARFMKPGSPDYTIPTGTLVDAGDRVLDFDILSGDKLFVDVMSYHFRKPKIGDAIVFRTREISGLKNVHGKQEDKYYIKRLVGTSGDLLEVEKGTLIRNGKPIEGAIAFEKNSQKTEGYLGYGAVHRLAPGRAEIVPQHTFFAMGDNSAHSLDSRYWGYVPEKEVVGRAFFIFYPFSNRWGKAE